jgi:hypothetical protein
VSSRPNAAEAPLDGWGADALTPAAAPAPVLRAIPMG